MIAFKKSFALYTIWVFISNLGSMSFLFGPDGMIEGVFLPESPSLLHWIPHQMTVFAFLIGIIVLSIRLFYCRSYTAELVALFICINSFWNVNPFIVHEPQQIQSLLLMMLIIFESVKKIQIRQLIQKTVLFFLCTYYFVAGLKKLPDEMWIQGKAIQTILEWGALNQFHFSYDIITMLSPFFILATWFTLIFEIGFPILFYSRFREKLLIAGTIFHIFLSLFLDVGHFAGIMMVWYSIAISDDDYQYLYNKFKKNYFTFGTHKELLHHSQSQRSSPANLPIHEA